MEDWRGDLQVGAELTRSLFIEYIRMKTRGLGLGWVGARNFFFCCWRLLFEKEIPIAKLLDVVRVHTQFITRYKSDLP